MKTTFTAFLAILVALPPATAAEPSAPAPKVIENSLGMKFVLIPAGTFLMGSDESPESLAKAYPQIPPERFRQLGDEAPVHKVRITRPFFLGQTEVTVGQFRRFLEASGYTPESIRDGTGGYGYNAAYSASSEAAAEAFDGRNPKYSWRDPGFPQTDDSPVVNVTWNDTVAVADWLSKAEGKRYRLPTEAEWEYACRAGTRSRYYSGNDPQSLLGTANVLDADAAALWPQWQPMALPAHDGYTFTAPVAAGTPNAMGLYDMVGNVWEWVSDWYDENYYANSPVDDPQGPPSANVRLRRGGSWHTWPFYTRCSFRNWNSPQTRYTLVGMRLLREAEPDDASR
jgi:formylglycine-generating enzyme